MEQVLPAACPRNSRLSFRWKAVRYPERTHTMGLRSDDISSHAESPALAPRLVRRRRQSNSPLSVEGFNDPVKRAKTAQKESYHIGVPAIRAKLPATNARSRLFQAQFRLPLSNSPHMIDTTHAASAPGATVPRHKGTAGKTTGIRMRDRCAGVTAQNDQVALYRLIFSVGVLVHRCGRHNATSGIGPPL